MWFSVYLRSPAFGARIASSLIPQSGSNLRLVFPPRADAASQRYRLTDICQSVRGWVAQRNVFLDKKNTAIIQTFSWLHTVKTTYNSIHQGNMLCYLCGSGTQVPSCCCAKMKQLYFSEITVLLVNNNLNYENQGMLTCFSNVFSKNSVMKWSPSLLQKQQLLDWRSTAL